MNVRIYTLAEARAALPQIILLLERIQAASRGLRELEATIAQATTKSATNGHLPHDPLTEEDIHETLTDDLSAALQELHSLGVELKDAERGLIDFYYERDGEVVYLCYMLGEDGITSWHRIDDGFAGRQPL